MRPRLLLVIAAAAVAALLSGTSRAGAGTAACTATATGKHVRTQLLKVRLTGTCPASGVGHGTLTFGQWPRIHADGVFALDYAAAGFWADAWDVLSTYAAKSGQRVYPMVLYLLGYCADKQGDHAEAAAYWANAAKAGIARFVIIIQVRICLIFPR